MLVGFSVTLLSSKGLELNPPTKTIAGIGGGMHVKLKFTDHNGNSKALGRSQEYKTASITPTPNPDWGNFNALFKAQDSFGKAEFLRIEVCLDDFSTNLVLGTCFIPLSLFKRKPKEYTFPMTRYKASAVHARDGSVLHPLGETTVRIHRIEEDSESPSKMTIRTLLMDSNIFNTRYVAECIAARGVHAESLKDVETFCALATAEGLELATIDPVAGSADQVDMFAPAVPETRKRSSITGVGRDSSGSLLSATGSTGSFSHAEDGGSGGGGGGGGGGAGNSKDPKERGKISPVTAEDTAQGWGTTEHCITDIPATSSSVTGAYVDVEVYENQRRQPYYPCDWSNKAYTRPLFSDLTYEVGYTFETLAAAVPPPNFTWSSEWCLDKSYTQTDENGWSYGLTFGRILANYKQNKSHTSPLKMMARRRKWVRRASVIDRSKTNAAAGKNALSLFQTKNTGAAAGRPDPSPPVTPAGAIVAGTTRGSLVSASSFEPKLASWRNDVLVAAPNAVVTVCKERPSSHGNVLIPWDQVHDIMVITPSILSVKAEVNRYLYDKHTGSVGVFRPADIEIFISTCPAVELKAMIDERKWFNHFKLKIRSLIESGSSTGVAMTLPRMPPAGTSEKALDPSDNSVPKTEELSVGSELVAQLDEASITLESRVRELEKYMGAHNTAVDRTVCSEKMLLLRRDCRLRLYMAALFGVGLQGEHSFLDEEIRAIMDRDFKESQKIQMATEIATANNRIEFYLDTAETRIRDAVLCGWNYKNGQLERCLEIFANGYFIEIVGLLGTFFDEKDNQNSAAVKVGG
jgi:hypothetical protein